MFLYIKYIQYHAQRLVHYIEEGICLVAVSFFSTFIYIYIYIQIARKAFIFSNLPVIIYANNDWHFELSGSF